MEDSFASSGWSGDFLIPGFERTAAEPLAEKNLNVATVRPMSKIPMFGSSAASGLRPPSSIPSLPCVAKRTLDKDEERASKRQRVDPSSLDVTLSSGDGGTAANTKKNAAAAAVSSSLQTRATQRKTTTTNAAKPASFTARPAPAATAVRPQRPNVAGAAAKRAVKTVGAATKPASSQSSVFVFKAQQATTTAASSNGQTTAPRPAGGKKRPAWDTKGRLEDMEVALSRHLEQNSSLQQQILSSNDRIAQLESVNSQLKGTVQQREEMTTIAHDEIAALQRRLREKEDELESTVSRLNRQLSDVEFARSTLERQKSTLESELSASRQEAAGLRSTVAQMSAAQAGIESELAATKVNLAACQERCASKDRKIAECEATIAARLEEIEEANAKIRRDETVRRKLHNTILELKGNIRVFSRVRPLIGDEGLVSGGEISHIHFPDDDHCMLELEKLSDGNPNESIAASRKGSGSGGKYEFKFDRVFSPTASQAEVFEEISQLVQSALDGYNVCIFAYGQTGSGKTYTMEGAASESCIDGEHTGMIPRAVTQVFETAAELTDKGWKYEFTASFLEIYNEVIRDLLGSGKDDTKHDVRLVSANSPEVYVTDLTTVNVSHKQQVYKLLAKASHNRSVAETKCNERSSRSHSVFRLHINGRNDLTEENCVGTLNLIDLAGSERLKESGSQGQRLKETQNINKSLANLGNVIMALANKDGHVPYRNSKLTHLLQNCLGGSSKTLMFVNVSPREECFQETLNSLRFATKVNECNIGTAQKKTK